MPDGLQQTFLYLIIPVVATVGGGILTIFWTPTAVIRGGIQHFAAGVVFAAVATELLPDILEEHEPLALLIGFALGVGLMLAMKSFVAKKGQKKVSEVEQPTALLLTIAVDFLIDGLLIGIAFSAGAREGFLITLALTIEAFFLSLTATGAFRRTGVSALSVLLLAGGFAILLAAGAVAGIVILGNLPAAVLAGLLAFGAAALLYLVTEELLVEAHHVPETPCYSRYVFHRLSAAPLHRDVRLAASFIS